MKNRVKSEKIGFFQKLLYIALQKFQAIHQFQTFRLLLMFRYFFQTLRLFATLRLLERYQYLKMVAFHDSLSTFSQLQEMFHHISKKNRKTAYDSFKYCDGFIQIQLKMANRHDFILKYFSSLKRLHLKNQDCIQSQSKSSQNRECQSYRKSETSKAANFALIPIQSVCVKFVGSLSIKQSICIEKLSNPWVKHIQ